VKARRLSVRISEGLHRALVEAAEARGVSLTLLVAEVLEAYALGRHDPLARFGAPSLHEPPAAHEDALPAAPAPADADRALRRLWQARWQLWQARYDEALRADEARRRDAVEASIPPAD
jgi:hypothetical protein